MGSPRGFQPVVRAYPRGSARGKLPRGPRATPEKLETRRVLTKPGVRGKLPRGPRATPEKLETRRVLTKQKYRPYQRCRYRLQRSELKTSLVFAMLCRLGAQS